MMVEKWIHFFAPETNQKIPITSMIWKQADEMSSTKLKVSSSEGKVLPFVFWDAELINMVDHLQKAAALYVIVQRTNKKSASILRRKGTAS